MDAEEIDELDESTNSSPETNIMSPDSNTSSGDHDHHHRLRHHHSHHHHHHHHHGLQPSCNESAATAVTAKTKHQIRNGSIEDDQQQAMMEAIEAMESIKVMNGLKHSDDSFDSESQDGAPHLHHRHRRAYAADTPNSDLVIDERSMGSHRSMERSSESPDTMMENGYGRKARTTSSSADEDTNKGKLGFVYGWVVGE